MTLEHLPNKLIEKGWIPWGDKDIIELKLVYDKFVAIGPLLGSFMKYSINDLCSIDSGFWKFVCGKKLYVEQKLENHHICIGNAPITDQTEQQYRLMLSSIQEEKGKFLLDNIRI